MDTLCSILCINTKVKTSEERESLEPVGGSETRVEYTGTAYHVRRIECRYHGVEMDNSYAFYARTHRGSKD